jgi:hypothetical protein
VKCARVQGTCSATLLDVENRSRCRSAKADSSCGEFAQFNLRPHFLQSRGKRFNLLLLLCYDRSLFFHFPVFFEEFVEQHFSMKWDGWPRSVLPR